MPCKKINTSFIDNNDNTGEQFFSGTLAFCKKAV